MICNNCGKEVLEGTDYCEFCGAPLNEPIIISAEKAKLKTKSESKNAIAASDGNDGKFFNLTNYIAALTVESYRVLALVAGLLLYLSPFFTWYWRKTGGEDVKANLFSIARKNGMLAQGIMKLNFTGVVMLLCGIAMVVYSARNYIRPVVKYSNKKSLWLAIEIISVGAFIITVTDSKLKAFISEVKNNVEFAKALGNESSKCGYGLGFYMAVAALVMFLFALFMGVLNNSEVDRQAGL